MKKIPSLDGLRALSVLFVILHHVELYYRYKVKSPLSESLFFFYHGQFGVTVFFIISGFLITALLLNEEAQTGAVSLKGFYFRRTLRIFPAYYFLLLVYFVLQRCGLIDITPSSWLTSLTYTKNFVNDDWFTRHAWSLSLEEQFYLVWPFVFAFAKKKRLAFAWSIVMLVPLIRTAAYVYPQLWLGNGANLHRIDALMWGCLLAVYRERVFGWVQIIYSRHPWTIAVPFLIVVGSFYFTQFNMALRLHMGLPIVALGGEYGTLICLAVVAILVYSVLFPRTYWGRFLNLRPIAYLGRLSYSLYLWQQLFICTDFLVSKPPLNFLCLFIAANISYFGIEKPFLQLRIKFGKNFGLQLYQHSSKLLRSSLEKKAIKLKNLFSLFCCCWGMYWPEDLLSF